MAVTVTFNSSYNISLALALTVVHMAPYYGRVEGGLHTFFSCKEDIFLINDSSQLFTELFLTFEIGI